MELNPVRPDQESASSKQISKVGAEVIVHAKGIEPIRGELLEWWYRGRGFSLPAVRRGDGVVYFGPAWTYMEAATEDMHRVRPK